MKPVSLTLRFKFDLYAAMSSKMLYAMQFSAGELINHCKGGRSSAFLMGNQFCIALFNFDLQLHVTKYYSDITAAIC